MILEALEGGGDRGGSRQLEVNEAVVVSNENSHFIMLCKNREATARQFEKV